MCGRRLRDGGKALSDYLITYDLTSPGRDYDELIDFLEESYGKDGHVLGSVWLVSSTQSVAELRDAVMRFLDSNDRLLVVKLSGSWATKNLKKAADWLKSD